MFIEINLAICVLLKFKSVYCGAQKTLTTAVKYLMSLKNVFECCMTSLLGDLGTDRRVILKWILRK
jgi:hypothetical protein